MCDGHHVSLGSLTPAHLTVQWGDNSCIDAVLFVSMFPCDPGSAESALQMG